MPNSYDAPTVLRRLDAADFDAMYDIMEASFPPDERRPREVQHRFLSDKRYNIHAMYIKDGAAERIAAFISVWNFGDMAYIEHFAVDSRYRNLGLGAAILAQIKNIYKKTIVLEVEPPTGEMARRRIEFYRRCGFVLNEYEYVQPPISDGKNAIPLMLMTTDSGIDDARFAAVRALLYTEVYGVSADYRMS